MTPPARGSIVAWAYGGAPQYGIVEGTEGPDRVFVRRLDGTRADRARLLPKPTSQVLELYTAEAFSRALLDRLRVARSVHLEDQTDSSH